MVCMHARVHRCGWNTVSVMVPHPIPPLPTLLHPPHPTPVCVYWSDKGRL